MKKTLKKIFLQLVWLPIIFAAVIMVVLSSAFCHGALAFIDGFTEDLKRCIEITKDLKLIVRIKKGGDSEIL